MTAAHVGERPRPHPAVETVFLAPEAVLWDGHRGEVRHLNASASAVWLCVDGEMNADEIATELSEIFEAPLDVIRPSVHAALADFARFGLLDSGERSDDLDDPHHDPVDAVSASDGIVVLPRPPEP